MTIFEAIFHVENVLSKFFSIVYIQLLVYGLSSLIFHQPSVQQTLRHLALFSPILAYSYIYGYERHRYEKEHGLPRCIFDKTFVHGVRETKNAILGCISLNLLVSSDISIQKQLEEGRLQVMSEIPFRKYMDEYDLKMTHFFLVALTSDGKIHPVVCPRINPMTDGLVHAVKYITSKLPQFIPNERFKLVYKINANTFLTDINYEIYE